jgi:cobalt/nickel transport protein
MKAKLMALAILFALLGFINSHAGASANEGAAKVVSGMSEATYQYGFSPAWHPSPEVQGLLFVLQAAVGCLMIGYFLRHHKERSEADWMQFP